MCGTSHVVNQPPEQTPAQIEADRIRLQELQRQNQLAAALLPGQQHNIDLMNQVLQYQLDHQGDLNAINTQQLELTRLQIQHAINDEAMQQELRPQQLEFLKNQNALALQTISFQGESNKYIMAQLKDQQARIDARNAAYSPQEEAAAAAEEARRATRMGAISEQAAQVQLENLKRGTKPTDEQLTNINEAYDASQKMGESDINKYLKDTLHTINEETAQAAGLRATDTPVTRLSERAGEEAARQEGQLTTSIAQGRATARLNYPLAASQLQGTQAANLQSITTGATNFQDQLRFAAANNRQQAFQMPSVGFAMPQSSRPTNLSFANGIPGFQSNPNAFGLGVGGGSPGGYNSTAAPNYGQIAQGIGSIISTAAPFFVGGAAASDVRVKDNIKRVGETDAGLPVYTYRYKGDQTLRMGVMAQEVERIFPDAVITHPSGIKMVKYAEIA